MLAQALFTLSLACSAFATVFITSPVGSSTFTAGQQATISWQDDGNSPSLAEFGASKVSIYAGNALQQTELQEIVSNVDVSTTAALQFTPDGSIGPNSNEYFVRIESLNLKDTEAPQFPALAFSAKFTMNGMTGTFSSAIQAQIDGQSTAPLNAPTASGASSSASATRTSSSRSSSATGSATGSASSAAASDNGSVRVSLGNGFTCASVVFGVMLGFMTL